MSFEHWLAFAAASAVMLAIPGPTILLVISYALGHGRRTAGATVAGVALGDFTAMTASMLGLGALLATSATIFTVLKWVGAAYLIWLGIKLWRAPVSVGAEGEAPAEEKPFRIFAHAYVVTALPQMVIFEMTFLVLATLNAFSYALLASAARKTIRKPSVQKVVNRTGGTLLIGAGLLTAGLKRATA
jgi:threonine/homoserine/homoserine lactone efflux protein